MSKSNKATFERRVADVTNLLDAGISPSQIREFAAARGWDVGERQLRRYLSIAYARITKDEQRSRPHKVSMHARKYRSTYARCVKTNDNRTALKALDGEARLLGLNSSTKGGPTTAVGQQLQPAHTGPRISIRTRTARYVAAELRDDKVEQLLLEQTSTFRNLQVADIHIATEVLSTMTHLYVMEQQEYAASYFYAHAADLQTHHAVPLWNVSMQVCAYRFWANREGWNQFAQWLGVSGDGIVKLYAEGNVPSLAQWQKVICAAITSEDEVRQAVEQAGQQLPKQVSPEAHAKDWREMFCHFHLPE